MLYLVVEMLVGAEELKDGTALVPTSCRPEKMSMTDNNVQAGEKRIMNNILTHHPSWNH